MQFVHAVWNLSQLWVLSVFTVNRLRIITLIWWETWILMCINIQLVVTHGQNSIQKRFLLQPVICPVLRTLCDYSYLICLYSIFFTFVCEYTDMHLVSANATCLCVCVWTYMLEAAADTWFDIGASKSGHLPQLPRDLDGFMEQQTKLPLVTRVTCWRYLAEEVWVGEDGVEVDEVERGRKRTKEKGRESERKRVKACRWYLK